MSEPVIKIKIVTFMNSGKDVGSRLYILNKNIKSNQKYDVNGT